MDLYFSKLEGNSINNHGEKEYISRITHSILKQIAYAQFHIHHFNLASFQEICSVVEEEFCTKFFLILFFSLFSPINDNLWPQGCHKSLLPDSPPPSSLFRFQIVEIPALSNLTFAYRPDALSLRQTWQDLTLKKIWKNFNLHPYWDIPVNRTSKLVQFVTLTHLCCKASNLLE